MIGSPDVQTHEDLINTHAPLNAEPRLHLTLRSSSQVRFFIASDAAGLSATRDVYHKLLTQTKILEQQAVEAEARRQAESTHIETPDPTINEALAWSGLGLQSKAGLRPGRRLRAVSRHGPPAAVRLVLRR